MTINKLVARARQEELELCKEDPVYFIEEYCKIEDKDTPGILIPFQLWDAQKEAVRSIFENKFNIILKARQLGISWLVLAVALHIMIFKEGSTVVALSRTENEAKELVRRIAVLCANMKEFIGEKQKEGMLYYKAGTMSVTLSRENAQDSVFRAFTSTPAAARSFTANLIIFDEWAYQQYAEEIWISGLPTVNRPSGGKVIGLSTMQLGTLFETVWKESNLFNKIFLPWSADPRRTQEWYDTTHALMGELIYQEYPETPEEAFMAPGGAFFHEFQTRVHVVDPFEIPEHWRKYHAIDYGLDMLASLWAAVDPEGNVYVYREVYESGLIVPEAAERMQEVEREEIHTRYAPPDLFGRSNETGRTRAEAFEECGFCFEKASADREAGWSNLKEWMRVIKNGEGKESAKLKIFRTCENLIRTLRSIPCDKKRPGDCATEPHELTHAPDALRYLLIERVIPAEPSGRREEQWVLEVENLLEYGIER